MKTSQLILAVLLWTVALAQAQVPERIPHQGTIVRDGTNYHGAGWFKFTIVNEQGLIVWMNDDRAMGGEPDDAVPLEVWDGAFALMLGDTNLMNMARLPVEALAFPNLTLRTWFSDGKTAFQVIEDQEFASAPYALLAKGVEDGAIGSRQLAAGAVTGANLAPGAVGVNQLAPGAVQKALADAGGFVFSTSPNAAGMQAAGLTAMGEFEVNMPWWDTMPTNGPNRLRPVVANVNGQLILWGGSAPGNPRTGEQFDYSSGQWKPIPSGGPEAMNPIKAATSEGLLLYNRGIGAIYNPSTQTWSPMMATNTGAPLVDASAGHVWRGNELLVWSAGAIHSYSLGSRSWSQIARPVGFIDANATDAFASGARVVFLNRMLQRGVLYNAATRTFITNTPPRALGSSYLPPAQVGDDVYFVPSAAQGETQVYSITANSWRTAPRPPYLASSSFSSFGTASVGDYILVLVTNQIPRSTSPIFDPGYRFDTKRQEWSTIASPGAPFMAGTLSMGVTDSSAVLAGQDGVYLYSPVADKWSQLPSAPRLGWPLNSPPFSVWTGEEFLIWGSASGLRFNPRNNEWRRMSLTMTNRGAATTTQSGLGTAVWTGEEMIVWMGRASEIIPTENLLIGARYNPTLDISSSIDWQTGPRARRNASMVWALDRMILWGGQSYNNSSPSRDGLAYYPRLNFWKAISNVGAPAARQSHAAVWTGSEMIVWGGSTNNQIWLNDGAKYEPLQDRWSPMAAAGPNQQPIRDAIWTGKVMAVLTTSSILAYNPRTDGWTTIPSVNSLGAKLVHANNKLIRITRSPQLQADLIDIENGTVKSLARVPLPGTIQTGTQLAVASLGDEIAVIVFGYTGGVAAYKLHFTRPLYMYGKGP